MKTWAAVIPGTVLLIPGAGGQRDVGVHVRAAVLRALRELLDGAARVTVLATGAAARRGQMRAELGAAGIASQWLAWSDLDQSADLPQAGIDASIGILALRAAGWREAIMTAELGPVHACPDTGAAAGLLRDEVRAAFADGGRLVHVDHGRAVAGGPDSHGPSSGTPSLRDVLAEHPFTEHIRSVPELGGAYQVTTFTS